MGEPTEFDDWEFLSTSEAIPCLTLTSNDPEAFEETNDGSDDNVQIKSDYFALESSDRYVKRGISHEELEVGFEGTGSVHEDSDCFDEKGEILREEDSKSAVGFQGIEAGHQNSDVGSEFGESSEMGAEKEEPKPELGFKGIDEGQENSDKDATSKEVESSETQDLDTEMGFDRFNESASGEAEVMEGSEIGDEIGDHLGLGEATRMEESEDSHVVVREGDATEVREGDATAKNVLPWVGDKKVLVLLKLPLDLIKLCVLKVKPVWSISIAAGIVGILMLGRRLYKMKYKSRSIPLKLSMDDKKASQIIGQVARVNETFSVMRRVPVLRLPPPAGGVTLWPVAGLL